MTLHAAGGTVLRRFHWESSSSSSTHLPNIPITTIVLYRLYIQRTLVRVYTLVEHGRPDLHPVADPLSKPYKDPNAIRHPNIHRPRPRHHRPPMQRSGLRIASTPSAISIHRAQDCKGESQCASDETLL